MKTIIVVGFGPGISKAVAEKFGKEGYAVALVGRTESRLQEGVEEFSGKGITAKAFKADVSGIDGAREVVARVKKESGPVHVLHWNAYNGGAGDLTKADPKELLKNIGIATASLVAAFQEALPDLRANKGALLVTNGGFGLFDTAVDQAVVQYSAMDIAIANSAKEKLVRVLHHKMKPEGVYVGEVMVTGTVKGTAWDQGNATLEPSMIAGKFWDLFQNRGDMSVTV